MTLPNIAFIGKAGAGKTTCAQRLVDGCGYERLSFAAPLKAGCGTSTDRELLQRVGTGMRELCPDFWVNLLLDGMDRPDPVEPYAFKLPHYVVDDCRFENEVYALKGEGFVIVRVVADRNVRVSRLRANGKLGDESELDHVSETALDDFDEDYTIHNVGDRTVQLTEQLTYILNRERR